LKKPIQIRERWRLFAGYVDTFLKYKQGSSNWQEWCDTEEKKDKYISDYLENEGVSLDREQENR